MKPDQPPSPSAEPFGAPLATKVADLLADGGRVLAGWCAHWMVKDDDRFAYQVLKPDRREVFGTPDRATFIAWLAAQSPRTLDGFVRPGCGDVIEIITPQVLAEVVAARAGVDDATPYGRALAEKVADALDRGVSVAFSHRDYCGMGLVKAPAGYVYGTFYDGSPEPEQTFATRDAFVTWLAAQSDARLSGRADGPFLWQNQRLTRARLLEAAG